MMPIIFADIWDRKQTHTAIRLMPMACAARKAVNSFQSEENPRFVAFDIGPCGKLLEPLGDLSFDDCYDAFAKIAKTAEKCGADLVIIETMSDTLEAKAAVLAVKENTSLPIFCTMTFDESYKTLTGGDVKVMTAKQFTMYYRNNLQTNVNIWQSLVRLFSAVVAVQHLTI